jgi:hypothetical protein
MVIARSRPEIPPAAQIVYEMLGWSPTGPDQEAILACRKQGIIVLGGEGAGKSAVLAKYFDARWQDDMAKHPERGNGKGPPLLYWLVGDDYSQVTEEFRYIEYDLYDMGYPEQVVKVTANVAPGYIEIKYPDERYPRLRIDTKSGKDPSKISRQRPDGIMICEAGQVDHMIFERCYGRTVQGGGWIIMAGTLEGSVGWYPQLAEAWKSGYGNTATFRLPSWTNIHVYPGGRADPKILQMEREQSDEYFLERIAGEVVPPKGLVLGEFRADLHIRDVRYDPDYPVHLWEDPGYGIHSAHALEVVQHIDGQLRVIDEIYDRGLTTNEIIQVAKRRRWWNAPEGLYVVSDPHYKDQHHSVHSVSDVWRAETGLSPGGERVKILAGIERLKTYLKPDPLSGDVGLVISPHCQGVLSELGAAVDPFDGKSYHPWRWKQDRFGEFVGPEPMDEFNHALKAIIYGIVYRFGYAESQSRRLVKVKRR